VTKSRKVPVNAAKQSSPRAASSISTARPVNTVAPKSKVNDALPTTYSYFKAHSPVRWAFNQKLAAKTNNLNEKVKTTRVNNVTTAGPKAVVSATDQGIFDNGCSRHMTRNKSFLTDYQEVDGGFVAFAGVGSRNTSLHIFKHESRARKEKERVVLERERRERIERENEKIFLDILNNLLFQVEKFLIYPDT
ncbi:hypothetical protein Tco_0113972, partial [Tanacetum coccineum]